MHWRDVFKLPPQPEYEKVEKEEQKMTDSYSELFQFPGSVNSANYNELPAELAGLIEQVGKLYKADQPEIDDMKIHVLKFINTQTNGLLVALNGFRQLANQFNA